MNRKIFFLILLLLASCSSAKPSVRSTPTTTALTYGGYTYETCEANWNAGFVDADLPQDGSYDLAVRDWILNEDQVPETRGGIIQDCINEGWWAEWFETLELLGWEYIATQERK